MDHNARAVELRNELWDFVRMMSQGVNTVFTPIMEAHGLTTLQARILMAIMKCGSATVGSVGEAVGVNSGNASTTCKKLEKAGFVKRVRDPADERYVRLVLTDRGQETIRRIDDTFMRMYGPILEATAAEDYETIITGMKILRRLITELGEMPERE